MSYKQSDYINIINQIYFRFDNSPYQPSIAENFHKAIDFAMENVDEAMFLQMKQESSTLNFELAYYFNGFVFDFVLKGDRGDSFIYEEIRLKISDISSTKIAIRPSSVEFGIQTLGAHGLTYRSNSKISNERLLAFSKEINFIIEGQKNG